MARETDEVDRVLMQKPAIPVKRIQPLNSAVKRTPSAPARTALLGVNAGEWTE